MPVPDLRHVLVVQTYNLSELGIWVGQLTGMALPVSLSGLTGLSALGAGFHQ